MPSQKSTELGTTMLRVNNNQFLHSCYCDNFISKSINNEENSTSLHDPTFTITQDFKLNETISEKKYVVLIIHLYLRMSSISILQR